MNLADAVKILDALQKRCPKRTTGVYITSHGITFGKRTNEHKFPANFIPFERRTKC